VAELTHEAPPPTLGDARDRLLTAAYELFARHGVQAVGVDTIIEASGVARQTLYRHFDSKQDLVLAFLARREEVWTRGWLQAQVAQRSHDPSEQLLAIFDVFDQWFRTPDFEGCSFINVMLEYPAEDHPVHRAAVEHLAVIRTFLAGLARRAGIADPETFARQWHILMKGSIVAAGEGDQEAARRAQEMARLVLAQAPRTGRARKRAVRDSSQDNGLTSPVREKPSRA
jgi:AcrR family transcriptional regulator